MVPPGRPASWKEPRHTEGCAQPGEQGARKQADTTVVTHTTTQNGQQMF